MRSHWTPKYIADRVARELWERRNPHEPWIVRHAIPVLDQLLKPVDIGLEWGSGRSTVWLAKRVDHLVSVEENESWAEWVRPRIQNLKVDYLVAKDDYVNIACQYDSFDFVLVDGDRRDECVIAALPRIKPGGLLIIDNVDRHLTNPNGSSVPYATKAVEGRWREIARELQDWRQLWFGDGTTETAIFIRA